MQEHNLLNEELQFTQGIKSLLGESARWAKFLSIVGLILSGLIVLLALAMPAIINTLNSMQQSEMFPEGSKTGITINFLIVATMIFFPSLFLLRFSNAMKKALEEINQGELETAFSNLKTLFRFYGILTIIILGLYVLGILLYFAALLGNA